MRTAEALAGYQANVEAERVLLACVLLDDSTIDEIRAAVKPEMFWRSSHRMMFETMCDLNDRGLPIDPTTLADAMVFKTQTTPAGKTSWLELVGGVTAISELTEGNFALPANIGAYSRIILRDFRYRESVGLFESAKRRVEEFAESPDEVIGDTVAALSELRIGAGERISERSASIGERVLTKITSLYQGESIPDGIFSTIPTMDRATLGFHEQDLIVVQAPPKSAKTVFAVQFAVDASVRQGKSGLFCNLEISKEQIFRRAVCNRSGVSYRKIRTGFLTEREFEAVQIAIQELSEAPLVFADGMVNTPGKLLAEAKRVKAERGRLDFIVADYLQLFQPDEKSNSEYEGVTKVSKAMKRIATEMNCPLVVISAVNRAGYDNPGMGAAKNSGQIEYDANVAVSLSPLGEAVDGVRDIALKCFAARDCETFDCELVFDGDLQRLAEKENAYYA